MTELKITIQCLKQDKQELEIKVDDFSKHGRSPNDDDYLEMIRLLENWYQIKNNIECLVELQKTVESNNGDTTNHPSD